MSTNLTISFDNNQIEEILQHFVLKQQDISAISTTTNSEKSAPKASMGLPNFLSIEEMCKLFKVSRVTINSWMKQGKIPFRKISRRVYFNIDEVIEKSPKYNLKSVHSFQKTLKNKELNSSI